MKKSWTVNGTVYTATTLLGHGKGGYSYLVKDPTGHEFTLKQIHHEPCSYYQFGNKILAEKNDYERLKRLAFPFRSFSFSMKPKK
jgi:hypothetical protein